MERVLLWWILFVVALILFFVYTVSFIVWYCLCPNILELQNECLELFETTSSCFEDMNATYWATYGTLLGTIREGNMIEYDDDIDLGMRRVDFEEKVFPVLKDYGLKCFSTLPVYGEISERWGYVKIGWDDSVRYHYGSYVTMIDLFLYDEYDMQQNKGKRKDCCPSNILWSRWREVNTRMYWFRCCDVTGDLPKKKFGDFTIRIPRNPEFYLTHSYGDWQTPIYQKPHYYQLIEKCALYLGLIMFATCLVAGGVYKHEEECTNI